MTVTKLILTGLIIASSPAFAAKEGGGGHKAGNSLLDLYEADSAKPVDPTTLPGFQAYALPVLNRIRAVNPGFADELSSGLRSKRWYLDSHSLAPCEQDDSWVKIHAEPLACQDEINVRIAQPQLIGINEKSQGGLIIHELLQSLRLSQSDLFKSSSGGQIPVRKYEHSRLP